MPLTYFDYVKSLGPSLYWPLNETSGAVDQSGNGRNGTANGGISVGAYAGSPISGESTATEFDGVNDFVRATGYTPFVNGSVRTFTGWARLVMTTAAGFILFGSGGANWVALQGVGSTGGVYFYVNATYVGVWAAALPTDTLWHHWTLITDEAADTLELFIGGVSRGVISTLWSWGTAPGVLDLGAYLSAGAGQVWNGEKAHFAVFERGLSALEIATLYRIGVDPVQPQRPPAVSREREILRETRCNMSLKAPDGQIYRLGGDAPSADLIPQDLQFGDADPGGFKDMSCALARSTDYALPDTEIFNEARIYLPGNRTAWEGTIEATPKAREDQSSVQLNGVGHVESFKDRSDFYALIISRDLGEWEETSARRKATFTSGTYAYWPLEVGRDPATGLPTLELHLEGDWNSSNSPFSEAFFDAGAGEKVGEIHGVLSSNPTSQVAYLYGANDDLLAGVVTLAGPITSGGFDVAAINKRVVVLQEYFPTSPNGLPSVQYRQQFSQLSLVGTHNLPMQGASNRLTSGYLVSDILGYLLAKFAPSINFTTGGGGSISPTSYAVPHARWKKGENVTLDDAISQLNGYHQNSWGVWDGKTFCFQPPDQGKLWRVRRSEGVRLVNQGAAASEIFNSLVVAFTDPAGKTQTAGPPGSGCDFEDAVFLDTDPANKATRHNRTKRARLDVSTITDFTGAIRIAAGFFFEARAVGTRGELTVSGLARDSQGVLHPVSLMRGGHRVIIEEEGPTPRRIISKDYVDAERRATLALDSTPHGLEAALERMGAALSAL